MDPSDLEPLVRQHAEALRVYAGTWTVQAEDVIQDAFVDLWRQDVPPDRPVAWLFAAVRRRAISRARSDGRRTNRERTVGGQLPATTPPVDAVLAGQDARAELRRFVEELPEPARELVLLRTWGGLTLTEAAAVTGLSPATAHRRYHAALADLRARLDAAASPLATPRPDRNCPAPPQVTS